VKQKNKRAENWLVQVVINLLENVSLLCTLVLFITGINELQRTNQLSLIDFHPQFIDFLLTYLTQPSLLVIIGFLLSLIALVISGKDLLHITNVFSQSLWIALTVINIPLSNKFIPESNLILLRPILCVFLAILSPINTCIRLFIFRRNLIRKQTPLIRPKKASETLSHNANVCSNRADKRIENNINSNNNADQVIRQQIEDLCILDESDNKRVHDSSRFDRDSSSSSIRSSLSYESSPANKIILPAKFHYESIAQTSWVSPFKPCPTQSRSPRKDNLNSALFGNSERLFSSSHWINHNMTGLVTPPPSAPNSICSKFYENELLFLHNNPLFETLRLKN